MATPTAPGMLNIDVPVWAYLFNVPGLHVSDLVAMDGATVLERFAHPWPAAMQNSPKLLSNMLDKGFSVTPGLQVSRASEVRILMGALSG